MLKFATAARAKQGGMFSSLRERNYRLYASGQLVSLIGTWMQRVAQDWLVLEITGKNPVALGVAATLQFLPTVILSLPAGVIADRADKRRLLLFLQASLGLCALALGLLDINGTVALWQVYIFCFVFGCFSAVETPVRQSFVAEMVGKDQVANAVALNSMMFNLARIIGPIIAGMVITLVGTGWVFLANFLSFAAVLAGLLLMDITALHRSEPASRKRGQLVEGLRYARQHRDVRLVLILVFLVSTFGITFFTTLAVAAANVFQQNAKGYGLLTTALGMGTLLGATLAARRSSRTTPRLRLVLGSALIFGVLEFLLGVMPTYLAFAVLLIPVGVALITFVSAANSTLQLRADPRFRGRVMGLYLLVFTGGNPIGGLLTGWLADTVNGRAPFIVGGVISVVAALGCGLTVAGGIRILRSYASRTRAAGAARAVELTAKQWLG